MSPEGLDGAGLGVFLGELSRERCAALFDPLERNAPSVFVQTGREVYRRGALNRRGQGPRRRVCLWSGLSQVVIC